jgi:hypothetical protein
LQKLDQESSDLALGVKRELVAIDIATDLALHYHREVLKQVRDLLNPLKLEEIENSHQ